ncbi:TMEM175 family protein [Enterococcus sp. AZ072]|uniref:TMEM175 family protein n=1 Tax=unclassified Enterococcus TaxID=2608891 RepID=UPI003D2D72D3
MKERVVLFSDAIIAIILTIMVLELPIKYAANGALNYASLFRAIGIYFISFCFVASVWFQMAYAFNAIEKVKNKIFSRLYAAVIFAIIGALFYTFINRRHYSRNAIDLWYINFDCYVYGKKNGSFFN